jgi:hypothetical protein
MARKTTQERIQAELDRKQQIQNSIAKLQQQQRAEERKARTKRLIERGAIVESLINGSPDMTAEQFYKVVTAAFATKNKGFNGKQSNSAPAEETQTAEETAVEGL